MKYVFFFGDGKADGTADDKNMLGGKGANLAEMTNLTIPVPPGFTLTTNLCMDYLADGVYPNQLEQEVKEAINNHNLKEGFDMWSEDDTDGRQRVAPAALISVMVKAVQELSTQVDELKSELIALKGD